MKRALAVFVSGAVALVGCSPTEGCHQATWLEATPIDTTLAVGQSFEPRVRLEECPNPREVQADLSSQNASVLSIMDGTVRAIAPGNTTVTATAKGMTDTIFVEVVEADP